MKLSGPERGMMIAFLLITSGASAQCDRWQQRVQYTMNIVLDHTDHRFTGDGTLVYTNNSPDTLREVWFHMYFNAFRPGSEMDVRSRTIMDPDDRVADRIAQLRPEEMGEVKAENMTQDGKPVTTTPMGTVLRAELASPLLPGKKTTLKYAITGQVPVQIRRSGRNNAEGIAYSMAQWYPKLANYDQRGWHAYPYVGREFHGEWGDFDVRIDMDSSFVVAATGVLQNADQGDHRYNTGRRPSRRIAGDRIVWHFLAKDVHDFAWAADPDFVHFTEQVPGGPLLHFFHERNAELEMVWKELPAYMVRLFQYMNEHFGKYPWPQYSFVQGGDGGMEYPMLTLITGKRRLGSLVGVSVHESVHSWYYGILASNEGRFPWMDEGFTEYASGKVMQQLFPSPQDPHISAFGSYLGMIEDQYHEPPSVHADHFMTNRVYGATAYSFGEMFLQQLTSVIGGKELAAGMLRYYNTCKF
ncbi:MAG: M1 family metallopeptidase, partial [Bacteroidota bacterium]|nr:M1 family metallopeptidase [Bacteroidota bacterium]